MPDSKEPQIFVVSKELAMEGRRTKDTPKMFCEELVKVWDLEKNHTPDIRFMEIVIGHFEAKVPPWFDADYTYMLAKRTSVPSTSRTRR